MIDTGTGKLYTKGEAAKILHVSPITIHRQIKEANGIISRVIQTFEKANEYGMLADALTIQGIVWARVGVHEKSISILRRAADVAENAGALSNAGLASLSLIEEHGGKRLNPTDLYNTYRRADRLLKGTQDVEETQSVRPHCHAATLRFAAAR